MILDPFVRDTDTGRVRGTGAAAPGVLVWRGIPYAAAPVGERRWQPPAPVQPWTGVRDATAFGPDSVQAPMPASRAPAQDEDCLHMNVWASLAAPAGGAPVMVWVHGGGFVGGSGADARAEGSRLAACGVVVVSFNYRSGVFGYLAHPALSAESPTHTSGNYGLQDQIAALRWVRRNIAAFGGDATRITAFGVSAGSASIALLLACPQAQGLFDRAILHSPGTGRPLAALQDAEQAGAAVGPLDALRRLPAAEVLALTARLNPAMRGLTTPRVLRPIRDGVLIPEDERPVFESGRLHRMPLVVGTNADEGTLLTRNWPVRTLADHRRAIESNFGGAVEEALAHYGAEQDADALPALARAFADTQFNHGARMLARCMARNGAPVWSYLFTRRRPGQLDGPHHGDEVAYVFGNLAVGRDRDGLVFDATDSCLSSQMASAWVSFARAADPSAEAEVPWPAFQELSERRLEWGDLPLVRTGDAADALDFVDRFLQRKP